MEVMTPLGLCWIYASEMLLLLFSLVFFFHTKRTYKYVVFIYTAFPKGKSLPLWVQVMQMCILHVHMQACVCKSVCACYSEWSSTVCIWVASLQ